MPRQNRVFARTPGKKIDFKQWASAPGLILSSSGAGIQLSGSLAFSAPATVLRWRGYVSAMFDESAMVGDEVVLTYGIAVLSTDAVTLGATAVPDPATDTDYPWVWWGEAMLRSRLATGAGEPSADAWGASAFRMEIDSKAMRKVKPAESLVIIMDRTNPVGGPTVEHDIGQLRVLLGT